MALSPQWLDELRTRITLSALIQRTVKLQRAGNEWKACCPFHDEKTPSFYVNDGKGFYHCFGCEAHGDAIRWLTENQGLAFMDAVKELAVQAGMELPAPDPAYAARAEQRATLHDVTGAAQDWFRATLHSPSGAKARDYLKTRGIDAPLIDHFGFGFAPDSRDALGKALSQFDEHLLIEAGMRVAAEEREPYDRFRGRLMLPIHDVRGRIIAFGGRILDPDSTAPKYLNSPDTPVFDKGRTLFNLHRAGPVARKAGRLVVVEGYMDVVALAKAGIEEAVAPMGTALTEQQMNLLWRLVDKPIVCFDGDAAGRRAAMRAIARALPLLQPGRSLEIVRLPAGLDPDDLVRREGKAAMEKLLATPKSMLETIWEHEREALPLDSPEEKAGLKARLLAQVDTIVDSDIRALYRRDLLDRFSAFAFPKRAPFQRGNVISFSEGKRRLRETFDANGTRRQQHQFRRLGAALAFGFLVRPDKLFQFDEELLCLGERHIDPRLALIINALNLGEAASTLDLAASICREGLALPNRHEFDDLPFPFTSLGGEEDRALGSLARGVRLYAGLPELREAFARANRRLEAEQTDSAWEEQERLRTRLQEWESSLRSLAAA